MRTATISQAAILLVSLIGVNAQLSTKCNPLNSTCPPDKALGGTVFYDFTKGAQPGWTPDAGTNPSYKSDGVHFDVVNSGQILVSDNYIFFGSVIAYVKSTNGGGVISSVILASDDRDEIDWEWLGSDNSNVQTNYFGGRSVNYGNSKSHPVQTPQNEFHKYEIKWSKDAIEWLVDDNSVRTLTYADAQNGGVFPQTPSQVRMGGWVGCFTADCLAYGRGDKSKPACDTGGTCAWASGYLGQDAGPYDMTIANVTLQDAYCGQSYSYKNMKGTWQDILGTTTCGSTTVSTAVPTSPASSPMTTTSKPVTTSSSVTTPTTGQTSSPPYSVSNNGTMPTTSPGASSLTTTLTTTTGESTITDAVTITDGTTVVTGITVSDHSTMTYTTTAVGSSSVVVGPTISGGKTIGTATSSIHDGTSYIASHTVTDGTTTSVTQTIIDGSTVSPEVQPNQKAWIYNFVINNGHHGPTADIRVDVEESCGCMAMHPEGQNASSPIPVQSGGTSGGSANPTDSNSPTAINSAGGSSPSGNGPSGTASGNANAGTSNSPGSTSTGPTPGSTSAGSSQGPAQVSIGSALRLNVIRHIDGVLQVSIIAFVISLNFFIAL